METIIYNLLNNLRLRGLVCVDDYINRNKINVPKFEILSNLMNNTNYSIQTVGKKGHEKHYLITKKNEINVINSINMIISNLRIYKDEYLSPKAINKLDLNRYNFFNRNLEIDINNIDNSIKSELNYKEHRKYLNENEYNNLFFRGQSIVEFETLPSIMHFKKYFENEEKMYNDLKTKNPSDFIDMKSHLEILQTMQHYTLPTRLLDVTTNVLVALYFACAYNKEFDGEIILYVPNNESIKNSNSDTIEILTAMSILNNQEKNQIDELITSFKKEEISAQEFNNNKVIRKLVHEINKVAGHFEPIINPDDLCRTYFVIPNKSNDRLKKQDGAFLVNGLICRNPDMNYEEVRELVISDIKEFQLKVDMKDIHFIIPSSSKQHILDDLNLMGINQSTLFPEIQNVASFIRSSY